jgi:CheY-like chemotaxis protein
MESKRRILIIDDDEDARELYSRILREYGFEPEAATSGLEGLEKARREDYNLILLDMMMPQMDGIEVLRQLKKQPPKSAAVPIVVISNLTSVPIAEEAISLGARACLVKTGLNPDQLVEKVRSYITG